MFINIHLKTVLANSADLTENSTQMNLCIWINIWLWDRVIKYLFSNVFHATIPSPIQTLLVDKGEKYKEKAKKKNLPFLECSSDCTAGQ